MTKQTFNLVKTILIVWMVIVVMGSILGFGDDPFVYFITIILGVLNVWFLTRFKVKSEPQEEIEIKVK